MLRLFAALAGIIALVRGVSLVVAPVAANVVLSVVVLGIVVLVAVRGRLVRLALS